MRAGAYRRAEARRGRGFAAAGRTALAAAALAGAGFAVPAEGARAQRAYPSLAQCAAGIPDNQVFIDSCGEGYRICPNGRKLGFSYCIPLSDAEKADIERQRRELEAQRRKAADAKAEYDRQVAAEVARLGAHRRAEAERLVSMRQSAQAARPQPKASTCRTSRQVRYVTGESGNSLAEARQRAERAHAASCGKPGWQCGEIKCSEQKPVSISLGNQTLSSGTKSFFSCGAPASEEIKVCDTKVSAQ